MSRPLNYLGTVSSLQNIVENLEVSLDKTRTEEENEWKVRYDVHMRYKRCLEMRMHRSQERVKRMREALRDGGLEYHRDFRMSTEHSLARLLYSLETEQKEKLIELERKEALLERESVLLKEERHRRRLMQQELDTLKTGFNDAFWTNPEPNEDAREILKEKLYPLF
ncbi:hypothetical protein RvY_17719-2 [Ramazzottius varieornatus]|uniref:Uncharacterized protein n=1 Tax=Ramazzottius varieornatus TaxID=947166 RepID=A0A1D1W3T5_RAMVA|nr:hypothetical protein RvY_17719-2 [Ramazzottius varieornatus]